MGIDASLQKIFNKKRRPGFPERLRSLLTHYNLADNDSFRIHTILSAYHQNK